MPDRILVVEDHPLYAEALATVVRRTFPRAQTSAAGTLSAAVAIADRLAPDLILLDLWLPDTHGLEGLVALRRRAPRTPTVIVSTFDDPGVIRRAIVCGAAGYIPKTWDSRQISQALRHVLDGEVVVPAGLQHELGGRALACECEAISMRRAGTLTPQQVRVLEKLCEGKLNKQIAHELEVGETTIKAHVGEILKKFNVSSRTQAVVGVASLDFGSRLFWGDDPSVTSLAGE